MVSTLPTAMASRVWDLGRWLRVRFHLVRPPEATWVGRRSSSSRHRAQRVDCTAAASRNGTLARDRIRANVVGSVMNSCTDWLFLAWLHRTHANTRLATRSDTPRERGWTWSRLSGVLVAPQ